MYLFAVYFYFEHRDAVLSAGKVHVPQEIVTEDIRDTDKPLGVDAFRSHYIVNGGSFHTQLPCELGELMPHSFIRASINSPICIFLKSGYIKIVWLSVS